MVVASILLGAEVQQGAQGRTLLLHLVTVGVPWGAGPVEVEQGGWGKEGCITKVKAWLFFVLFG